MMPAANVRRRAWAAPRPHIPACPSAFSRAVIAISPQTLAAAREHRLRVLTNGWLLPEAA